MNNKKLGVIWVGILSMIIIPLLSIAYICYDENHFSCESQLILIGKDDHYNSIMHYTFADGFGNFESLGSFHRSNNPPVSRTNNFPFKYWKEQGDTIMVADDSSDPPEDMKQLFTFLPDFFYTKDRGLRVHILRENDSGYLFTDNNSPLFYCTRIPARSLNPN